MPEELDKELEPQNTEESEETILEGNESESGTEEAGKESTKGNINVEELTKALRAEIAEAIRKEEKDKLYPSIEKHKEEAKKALDAKKAAEDRLKEYETKNLTAEEQTALKFKELENVNLGLQSKLEEIVNAANDKITTLELQLMKKEVLSKYGSEIIPELVNGSTVEEIIESAENAHRRFKDIFDSAKESAKPAVKKPAIGSGLTPGNDSLKSGITVADIEKMDAETFAKNRDRLLEEALKH